MKFKRKVQQIAGTFMIGIPKDLARFYNIKKGDVLILQDVKKKIWVYKEAQNDKKTNKRNN